MNKNIQQPEKALFIQRFAAFIIDIMLISTIASFIALPFLDGDSITKLNESATEIIDKYAKQEIEVKTYIEETANITYQMARKNGIVSLINITLAILYFVVYQFYHKGQTIGKKLFRIQVVSHDESELTMNQMIFRSLIINSILIDMVILGFAIFASRNVYFYGAGTFEMIQFVILFVSASMVMFSKNGRGFHDRVAQTKVIRTDLVKELEVCES